MADTITTPNMSLTLPVPGQASGPNYALDLNASLAVVDSHTHSAGSGVQVTPAGLNINSDLPFGNNNAIGLRSARFTSQASPIALASDIGCIYVAGADLYYNDVSGNKVRITQAGSVAGAAGTITGLPSGTASAAFGGSTFTFQAATSTPANLDGGSFILRNNVANSKGLTLAPPNAMAANITETLPSIPSVTSIMQMDASGNMSAALTVDSVTTAISGSNIVIKTNANIPGTTVQTNSKNVVVSSTNASAGLAIIRGVVSTATGGILTGEGFTCSHVSTGIVQISYTTAFVDSPSTVCSSTISGPPYLANVYNPNSTSCALRLFTADGSSVIDGYISFIVVGIRTT